MVVQSTALHFAEVRDLRSIEPNLSAASTTGRGMTAVRGSAQPSLCASNRNHLMQLGATDVTDPEADAGTRTQRDAMRSWISRHVADVRADAHGHGAAKFVTARGIDDGRPSLTPGQVAEAAAALRGRRSRVSMLQTAANLVTLPATRSACRTAATEILDSDRVCAFYCAAGKDRIPLGAASLATLAGHSIETILDHYLEGATAVVAGAYATIQDCLGEALTLNSTPVDENKARLA